MSHHLSTVKIPLRDSLVARHQIALIVPMVQIVALHQEANQVFQEKFSYALKKLKLWVLVSLFLNNIVKHALEERPVAMESAKSYLDNP